MICSAYFITSSVCCVGSDEISVGEESLPISGDLEGEREGEDEEEEELNEEEAWLDALESGTVDNTGYLPQKKDPRLLTTRQVSFKRLSSTSPVVICLRILREH